MYNTKVIDLASNFDLAINEGVNLIKKGDVVAFPTETVYGLGADACRVEAVNAIFIAKGRPVDNPLIVHVCDIDMASQLAHITKEAQSLMEQFWPGPLTIVLPKRPNVPYEVTGGLKTVALRMPHHEGALALIEQSGVPIAAPSANRSGKPSPTCAQHVYCDLKERIELIIDGGPCRIGVESTVLTFEDQTPVILRPGAVTPGMIEAHMGCVRLSKNVLQPLLEGEEAISPGMKHTHYAPSATVVVVEGSEQFVVSQTMRLYDEQSANQKNCIIFATAQTCGFYDLRNYVIMGDRNKPELICRSLFARLRKADDDGIDFILIEALPASGMGLAFMNRTLRAAAFKVIRE